MKLELNLGALQYSGLGFYYARDRGKITSYARRTMNTAVDVSVSSEWLVR